MSDNIQSKNFSGDASLVRKPFHATATLTATAAGTAVTLLADGEVPTGRKLYLDGFVAKVNGTTAWTTATSVFIQDSAGSPVTFFTLAVSSLTSEAELHPGTSGVTSGAAYYAGTGSTAAHGLQVVANVNAGAGSNLVVTVFGFIV